MAWVHYKRISMELITTVFSQLRADLNEKLNTAERQMLYLLKSQDSTEAVKNLEARIALLEARGAPTSVFETPAPQIRSGGLEGLLMKRENMPSPILGPTSANSVIVPTIQRQHTVLLEEKPMTVFDSLNRARIIEAASHLNVEEEVDDEVAYGEAVAAQGGIDDEEEVLQTDESRVLSLLTTGGVSIDEIHMRLNISIPELRCMLIDMSLNGDILLQGELVLRA